MKVLRFIFFPFAIIYWCITSLRNFGYSKGIMKSSRFDAATINVGNLSMGGTGKTPHVEYLIRLLKDQHQLATLSRGFGRTKRGFVLADEQSNSDDIGDEPLQFYTKFKNDVVVAVEANRVLGAMDLFYHHPERNVLLLDDAFQHRAIHADCNILLTDFKHPYSSDYILPLGNLRESRSGSKRAQIIVMTKCPDFQEVNKEQWRKKLKVQTNQHFFLSRIKYHQVLDLQGEAQDISAKKLIVVTGIAKPDPLIEYLNQSHEIIHHFNYRDHYRYKASDINEIHNLFDKFANENVAILTTEKDMMRLINRDEFDSIKAYPWMCQTIKVELDEPQAFDQIIKDYVEKNH